MDPSLEQISKPGKKRAMRGEKKSETLEVRLSHSQKRDFMDACKERESTASDVVRSFISGFIEDAQRTEEETHAQSRFKELSMTLRKNPRKLLTAGAGAIGTFALFGFTPSVADDDVFARLDKNGDGKLVAAELSDPKGGGFDSAKGLISSMDFDGDGALSEAEFHAPKGCVVRREDKIEDGDGAKSRTISINMTAYDFSDPEMSQISSITSDKTVDADISDDDAQEKADDMMAEARSKIQQETGNPSACEPRESGKKIEKRIKKTKEMKKSREQ